MSRVYRQFDSELTAWGERDRLLLEGFEVSMVAHIPGTDIYSFNVYM